jgi:hypothetical protein
MSQQLFAGRRLIQAPVVESVTTEEAVEIGADGRLAEDLAAGQWATDSA